MDTIGASHIAFADLIIGIVTIVLIYCLSTLDPNDLLVRMLAVVCACMILVVIATILLATSLTAKGVQMLALVGMWLAYGLLGWNRKRIKSKRDANPQRDAIPQP